MQIVTIPREKRIFDIIMSVFLLILLSPFIVAVLWAMLLESVLIPSSRGRFFYSETRISEGRPFTLYKFRIFKQSSLEKFFDQNGFVQTKELENDRKNFTYVGSILRQIYMDELPQLICVLKGDMSLVGPRPTNPVNAKRWLQEGKYSKHLIKAGLTGYFQSYKGTKHSREQNQTDMKYIEYCRNNPGWKIVLLDAKILIISAITVLK
ncbi:MAG: sugar transferase, partial [Candidatus Doudnabacteria bacterium]|nr:sugar transferase [Candidatus Doudnabacteria bacterium]